MSVQDKHYDAVTIQWICIADVVEKHILTSLKRLENVQDFFLKTDTETSTLVSRLGQRPGHLPQDEAQDICLKTKTKTLAASPRPRLSKLVHEEFRDQDLVSETTSLIYIYRRSCPNGVAESQINLPSSHPIRWPCTFSLSDVALRLK